MNTDSKKLIVSSPYSQLNEQAQSEWDTISRDGHAKSNDSPKAAAKHAGGEDEIFTAEMRHSLHSSLSHVLTAVEMGKSLEEVIDEHAYNSALNEGREPPPKKKSQTDLEFEAEEKRLMMEAKKKIEEEEKQKSKSLSSTKSRLMERVAQYRYNDKMRGELEKNVKAILKSRRAGHRPPSPDGTQVVAPNMIAFNKQQLQYGQKEVRLERVQTMAAKTKARTLEVKQRRESINKVLPSTKKLSKP